MSRVGKTIITIPPNIKVETGNGPIPAIGGNGYFVSVTGPTGVVLTQEIKAPISLEIQDGKINIKRSDDEAQSKSLHGLYNRLIQNMLKGVTTGFTRTLILNGVGYKASLKGNNLVVNLGKSHADEIAAEGGIKFKICTPQEIQALNLGKDGIGVVIQVSGANKEQVGATAGKIRALRPVEPYHMYGIRYSDEHVIRKESKSGAKGKKK